MLLGYRLDCRRKRSARPHQAAQKSTTPALSTAKQLSQNFRR
jgi:hypothetical protein